LSLALADGHIVWESETVFDDCEALVLPDATSILAITRSGRASTELIRVDSTTGKQLWRVALERTESRFPRLVSTAQTAVVLILTEEDKSKISWWDIATGKPVAEATSDSILDYLCIDSNRVYLCGDDRAQAFRLDGQLVWSVALPAAAGFCHGMCIGPGGVLLLSFAEQGALAINCDDGSSIWHIRDHCINQVYVLGPEEVVIGPGDVGFFASGEKCIARNLLDGSLRWELGVGPDNSIRSLAVTESAVVIGTSSGRLLLADIASGEQIGSIGLDMMVGTRLVLAADGSLCCIAAPTAWPNHESFLFCVDLGQGKPAGPWPMAGQSRSGAAFLHTEKTETYGKFAFSSVQVGKI